MMSDEEWKVEDFTPKPKMIPTGPIWPYRRRIQTIERIPTKQSSSSLLLLLLPPPPLLEETVTTMTRSSAGRDDGGDDDDDGAGRSRLHPSTARRTTAPRTSPSSRSLTVSTTSSLSPREASSPRHAPSPHTQSAWARSTTSRHLTAPTIATNVTTTDDSSLSTASSTRLNNGTSPTATLTSSRSPKLSTSSPSSSTSYPSSSSSPRVASTTTAAAAAAALTATRAATAPFSRTTKPAHATTSVAATSGTATSRAIHTSTAAAAAAAATVALARTTATATTLSLANQATPSQTSDTRTTASTLSSATPAAPVSRVASSTGAASITATTTTTLPRTTAVQPTTKRSSPTAASSFKSTAPVAQPWSRSIAKSPPTTMTKPAVVAAATPPHTSTATSKLSANSTAATRNTTAGGSVTPAASAQLETCSQERDTTRTSPRGESINASAAASKAKTVRSSPIPQRRPVPPKSTTAAVLSATTPTTSRSKTSSSKKPSPVRVSPPSPTKTKSPNASPRNSNNNNNRSRTSFDAATIASSHKLNTPRSRQPASVSARNGPASNRSTSMVPCACGACGDACCCPDCVCADELCQCKAFQLVHSINGGTRTATEAVNNRSDRKTIYEFIIDGMTCSMCSQAIERAVGAVRGVDQVHVSLATDTATVTWSTAERTDIRDCIVQAIEEIGYDVVNAIPLSSLSPRRDSPSHENVVVDGDMAGETSSSIHVAERWKQYRHHQIRKVRQRRAAALWAFVFSLPIVIWTMILPHFVPHLFDHCRHVTLPHWLVPSSSLHTFRVDVLVVWLFATLVQFVSGWDFYRMAWHGFRKQTAGMDLLIVLGTTASYGYATNGVWTNDASAMHFFETSAVLIVLVLVGKWMQAAAVRQTGEALVQLMELQSSTAIQITPRDAKDTQFNRLSRSSLNTQHHAQQRQPFNPLIDPYNEEIVSIEQIKRDDIVKVLRGASVPADGVVLFGEILVDESMMTGESFPVLKTHGSVVLGGTICVECGNGDESIEENIGAAFVQVTGVGSSTALAQMVQLVQQAQSRAVPIQAFADQVSAIFVPTVCMIALITYLVWYGLCSTHVVPSKWYRDELGEDSMTFSLKFAIACLVISCPCALGLATPTAVMVGTGVSAKGGVLMKGGAAIEIASHVDTIIFDKTGTLTKGAPTVTEIHHFTTEGNYDTKEADLDSQLHEDYLLWLFGSLERNSEHPLGRAIVAFATEKLGDAIEQNPFVHATDFRAITGRGASGVILGKIDVAIGNRSFAEVLGLRVSSAVDKCMSKLEAVGQSAILAAVDGTVRCVLGVADEVKPDAAMSIAYLQDILGLDVWMVTGDNSLTAAAISKKIGIHTNRVVAEALPAAKMERVKMLQAEGRVVCMVGDGINDSAALAQADVGIGMGATGAEIAMEAADIILVKGKVGDVCTALHLSRAIFRRIQWNLVLSLVYNCMGIPIAAGAFYFMIRTRLPPTVAAVAMALSSISVVLSSLSLRFYQPPNIRDSLRRNHRSRRWNATTSTMSHGRSLSRLALDSGDDDMRVDLLSNDHLESSDETFRVDNRTVV